MRPAERQNDRVHSSMSRETAACALYRMHIHYEERRSDRPRDPYRVTVYIVLLTHPASPTFEKFISFLSTRETD